MIVLDALAAVELVLQTPRAERIAARALHPAERLHAPHLVDVEVAQVMRRLVQGVLPAGMRDWRRCRLVALGPRPFRATGATHEQNRGRSAGGFGPAATTAG